MTDKEKAKRYDALMVAIKHRLDCYNEHLMKALSLKSDTQIGAFHYGEESAYRLIIDDLERWTE